jgi:hypothetical protein
MMCLKESLPFLGAAVALAAIASTAEQLEIVGAIGPRRAAVACDQRDDMVNVEAMLSLDFKRHSAGGAKTALMFVQRCYVLLAMGAVRPQLRDALGLIPLAVIFADTLAIALLPVFDARPVSIAVFGAVFALLLSELFGIRGAPLTRIFPRHLAV